MSYGYLCQIKLKLIIIIIIIIIIPKLPDDIILCTMDVVDPLHKVWRGCACIKKTTRKPKRKICPNWYLIDLAEVVWKKPLKQKRGTAIGTTFAPPFSILLVAELVEDLIKVSEYKPYLW